MVDEDELDEAKKEIADLREALGRINEQTDAPSYVVIYDHGPEDYPNEEYYGFFASVPEAEQAFAQLGQEDPRGAKVCMVVKELSDG
jgi:hypothetical protein